MHDREAPIQLGPGGIDDDEFGHLHLRAVTKRELQRRTAAAMAATRGDCSFDAGLDSEGTGPAGTLGDHHVPFECA